jgi:hypothetical protein
LNEKTQNIVPYMISQNWLASYSSKDGIELTEKRMDYRIKNQSNMQKAITELNEFEFDNIKHIQISELCQNGHFSEHKDFFVNEIDNLVEDMIVDFKYKALPYQH